MSTYFCVFSENVTIIFCNFYKKNVSIIMIFLRNYVRIFPQYDVYYNVLLFLYFASSYHDNGKLKKSIVALLEYCPMAGLKVPELHYMLSSLSVVKKVWHLKDLHTELYVKQMGDGVIHFQGAMVRKVFRFLPAKIVLKLINTWIILNLPNLSI